MRWVSNRESVREGEPSVLAIAETLIAMGLTLWIAVHFGTVKHVVIGACIAPFLLLRTDDSAMLGLRTAKWIDDWRSFPPDIITTVLTPPGLLMLVLVRMFATVGTIFRTPAAVIRAIPRNWRRITVATDSFHSPQVLPMPDDPAHLDDVNLSVGSFDVFKLVVFFRVARPSESFIGKGVRFWIVYPIFLLVVWLFIVPIVSLPPFLYRWSLKSTAIIWFPLLWALRPVGPGDEPLKVRLSLFEKSDLLRIVLFVSAAALLLFAGKLIFWNELAQASNTWNESIGGRILTIHVAPGVIEWWQIATALNSAIAIGLWLYVRSCLRHDEAGVPRRETVVESLLAWGLFVRRLLTSYTIVCVGYLYLREAVTWQLPPLGGKLFPWI